ncbi:MAG: hypothetical protein HY280_04135 [Nitrospinae bacterium]|nr:hypothetical protein [Nitrospinota bacterium]
MVDVMNNGHFGTRPQVKKSAEHTDSENGDASKVVTLFAASHLVEDYCSVSAPAGAGW